MLAVPVLAIIVVVSLVWSLAAPSTTPNQWIKLQPVKEVCAIKAPMQAGGTARIDLSPAVQETVNDRGEPCPANPKG